MSRSSSDNLLQSARVLSASVIRSAMVKGTWTLEKPFSGEGYGMEECGQPRTLKFTSSGHRTSVRSIYPVVMLNKAGVPYFKRRGAAFVRLLRYPSSKVTNTERGLNAAP